MLESRKSDPQHDEDTAKTSRPFLGPGKPDHMMSPNECSSIGGAYSRATGKAPGEEEIKNLTKYI